MAPIEWLFFQCFIPFHGSRAYIIMTGMETGCTAIRGALA